MAQPSKGSLQPWWRDGDRLGVILAALWFVGVLLVGDRFGLTPQSSRMLAIFGGAVALWVSEAIPLSATSILVIMAEILLISDEALVGLPSEFDPPTYESIYATLANPILMLFLGGFVLADAAAKFGLDRNLAGVMLKPFGNEPKALVGGLMVITAVLSMFVSNTATTAAMMSVVLPVAAGLKATDRFRVALILAVPVAANVGGLGTPVGSPPNAIALGRLNDQGIEVNFLTWMAMAVPVAAVLLLAAWFLLTRRYPASVTTIDLEFGGRFDRSRPALILYTTFALTVVGWMTEPFHGINSSIIGFLPVVVLLSTKVFSVDDLRRVNWHILWLVGGGIALGNGVSSTGLDVWLIDRLDWGALPPLVLAATLSVIALAFSTVISNSATANLMAPVGISLALSDAVDLDPLLAGLLIAMACSLAMALPVSTPPNAVAYASGEIESKDMAIVGLLVGGLGLLIVVLIMPPIWRAVGLL